MVKVLGVIVGVLLGVAIARAGDVTCTDSSTGTPVSVDDVCTAAVGANQQAYCGTFAVAYCAANQAQVCGQFCADSVDTYCGDAYCKTRVDNVCPLYCESNAASLCAGYVETVCGDIKSICQGNSALADIASTLGDIEANCKQSVKTGTDTNVTCAETTLSCGASGNSISCPSCPSASCPSAQPLCADLRIRRDRDGRIVRQRCLKWTVAPSAP